MWGWGGFQARGQRLCQTCTESVLVNQSCLTPCDPMNSSLPSSSVHGILQARILDWVAIPSPRDLPDPEIKAGSPALQVDSLPSEPPGKPCIVMAKSKSLCHCTAPEGSQSSRVHRAAGPRAFHSKLLQLSCQERLSTKAPTHPSHPTFCTPV